MQDATDRAAYDATLTLAGGGVLRAVAVRGTQTIGRLSGNPIGATDFGRAYISIDDTNNAVEIVVKDDTTASAIIETLKIAFRIADSRNEADDTYPQVTA